MLTAGFNEPSAAFSKPSEQAPKDDPKASPAAKTAEIEKSLETFRTFAKGLNPAILELAKKKPNVVLYFSAARAQAAIGNRDEGLAILREGVSHALPEDTAPKPARLRASPEGIAEGYSTLAEYQALLGEEEAALETLRHTLKLKYESPPTVVQFAILRKNVIQFTQLKAIDDAKAAVKQPDDQINALTNADAKKKLMPGLVGLHVAAGDVEGGFALFEHAKQESTAAETDDFLGWILSSANLANDSIAKMVVDRLLPRVNDFPSKENGSRFALLLAIALAKLGDFPKALEMARGIESADGDPKRDSFLNNRTRALTSIAKYQNRAGKPEEARKTLTEAYGAAKLIKAEEGREGRPSILSRLSLEMMRVNDFPGALRCIEDTKPGERYGWLAIIATSQKAAGDKEGANATLLRAMEDTESLRPTLTGVAEKDNAEKVQTQVRRIYERSRILAMMGNAEEALGLLDAITEPKRHERFLVEIARAQGEVGDAEAALAWIRKQPVAIVPELSIALLEGMGYHAEMKRQAAGLPLIFPNP